MVKELDTWLEAAVGCEVSPPPAWGRASPLAEVARPSSSSRPTRLGSNCLKAAAAAHLNHQKKKLYMQGLETRLQGLVVENQQLCNCNRGLCRCLHDLEQETGYLRAMLANQSALGHLLRCQAGDGAGSLGLCMRISTSLFQPAAAGAFGENSDHNYTLPIPAEEPVEKLPPSSSSASPSGVCLHVDREHLLVEFCSLCTKRVASSETLPDASSSSSPLPLPAAASSLLSKIFSFRCLPCQASLCRV
ncbi:hypothetical protein E2320_020378 [Naja naja]|nr:hypothetical protein E2320_020378 [Naja naja]